MLWRKRYKSRVIIPVAGILLSIFWLELTSVLFTPNTISFWFTEAVASSGSIDPNGDALTNTGTRVTCGGTLYFDCMNDAVRDPTSPTTGSDYVEYAGGNQTNSEMSTLTGVATATAIAVKTFHRETGTNMTLSASLVNAAGVVIAGPTAYTNRGTNQWDTITFSGLTLTQTDIDGLRVRLSCARSGGSSANRCRSLAMYADVTYDPVINVTIGSVGSQQNVNASTTGTYIGGAFSIVGNVGSRSITSVTITENGTINAQDNLKNIKLLYDLDTSAPYDCASESYAGSETQFGSTVAGGFSSANGTAAFSGSVTVSPTQTMCIYVLADIQGTSGVGDTIEVQITTPTTDVVGSGSPVISPATAITLSGTSIVQKVIIEQANYHWRDDDGSESGATSVTGGLENTANTDFPKGVPQRLRLAISNEGNTTSSAIQYRLEYAAKVTTCAAATGWIDIGSVGGSFDMAPTGNLIEGTDTTNIATSTGGVSDPNTSFLTPNGGVLDISSQTNNITLTSTQFVEIEYSISATTTLSDGSSYCFRVTNSGVTIDTYTNYPEIIIGADLGISATGTQSAQLLASTTNQYVGGAFRLVNNTGDTDTLTSLTITASGTSNVQSDFANIRLLYDLDTSAPYDCASESYAGSEPSFGSTVSAFDVSKKANFTSSLNITNTQTACLYVVVDVASTSQNNTTLEVFIGSPSSDISIGGASISPNSQVDISGTSIIARSILEQVNYHWRNNDGTESGASSAVSGNENTVLLEASKETNYRLRMAISNEGLATSSATAYRLEWAQKLTTCAAATGWARIDTAADAWQMGSTTNLTDGGNTTNIATSTGGVSDPNPTFLSVNGGVKDDNDTTAGVTLTPSEFIELEYSVQATTLATQGASYCFRVTNAGTVIDTYTRYPEIKIKLDTDFKIQRGTSILTGTTLTINAGTEYTAPASSTRSFIRITNTQLTGAGPDTTGNLNANVATVYISNPSNITSSITFTRTAATANTKVSWEIIEYRGAVGGENEIVVHRQEALSYAAAGTTVTSSVISGVASGTKVVAFITGQHNQDAGRNSYNLGLSTANFSTSTNQVTLTRGASGAVSDVSYALVEFVGSNWKIQRVAHNFTAVGTTQTEQIATVNSLSRTFVHVQKRLAGANINHSDFGHEVWLSSVGQVSFLLDGAAANPTNHTSVAWIIENTQSVGARMMVTRSNGLLPTAGTANESNNISIGKTISDMAIASLFVNNRSDEAARTWPEPILGVRLLSTTQYELWRGNPSSNVNYRTELVEWPTAARELVQNYYRLYVNNNSLKPTDPWPAGAVDLGENEEMTGNDSPVLPSGAVRIRMTVTVTSAVLPATLDAFALQYAEKVSTCSAVTNWENIGAIGSTTAAWRGFNASTTAGTALSTDPETAGDLLISVATVAGTYEEENNSALNPYLAYPGDEIEYDWVVQHNLAKDKTSYCFRMVEADGTSFQSYNNWPVVRTVGYEPKITNWRWYDDETNSTPSTSLSLNENVAPIDIANQNVIKLRLVLHENSGATGYDTKFALQYSQHADFATDVFDLTSSTTCLANSIWCYADGAGVDNGIISDKVISDADSCSAGVGAGCGTYNEATSTPSTFDHAALTNAEFEFTIRQAGARANAVYFFRLYDLVNNEVVSASSSYPSLVTEGASLSFAVTGLPSGTSTAGVTTNITASSTGINFSPMMVGTDYIAAHRLVVNTNATEGYQVLGFARQQLLNSYGDEIEPIPATNSSPVGWSSGCLINAVSCVGYHTSDAVLQGGSARFAATDSYAGLHTTPEEIMYSSVPTTDVNDVIYRIKVSQEQPAGDYDTEIVYLAIPTF